MTSRSLGHRAPLLWLALPMMAGLAMGKATAVGAAIPWLLGGALVAATAASFARRRAPGGWAPMLCAAMILAGMVSYALHRSRLTAWETLPPREARLSLRIDRVFPSIDARKAAGLATIRHTDAHLRDLVGQRVYFSLALRPGTAPPLRSAEVAAVGVIETLPRDPAADTFEGYLASAGINFRFTRGRWLMEEKAPTAYRRFCARTADRISSRICHSVPSFVKYLIRSAAGSPRLTSSWVNRPRRARVKISSDRSVARIWTCHPERAGKCSRSSIATLYGSWPVEQAAHQMVSFRPAAFSGATMGTGSGGVRLRSVALLVVVPVVVGAAAVSAIGSSTPVASSLY